MYNVITNNDEQCRRALEALHNVYDPEIGLNIVDLGLICQVDFDDQVSELFMSMTLTTQFCPMGQSIRDAAQHALEKAFPGYTINIDVIFDPPWSAERISDKGKEFLNQ